MGGDDPAPDVRPTPLGRLLRHPKLPVAAFGVMAVSFIALVGVYMNVVNRDVAYAVRVEAGRSRAIGDPVAFRVGVYRPSSGDALVARVDARSGDATALPSTQTVSSDALAGFHLAGAATEGVSLAVDFGEGVTRELQVPLPGPVAARSRWLSARGLRSLRGTTHHATDGGVSRLRVDPADGALDLVVVAEGGVPVRFLENTFYARLHRSDGTAVAGAVLRVETPSGAREVTTDALGLATFRATPTDLEIWTVSTADPESSETISVRLEVAPSFDGITLALAERVVGSRDELVGTLAVQREEPVYLDVLSDDGWLLTARPDPGGLTLSPPFGSWNEASASRVVAVQAYSQPFAARPQSAVLGLVMRGAGQDDASSMAAFVAAMRDSGVDESYLTGVQRDALLTGDALGSESFDRLVGYLFARLRPVYRAPQVVYDDAGTQAEAMAGDIGSFRRRAHWLMALGSLALVAWMVARIVRQMYATKARTREVVLETDDPEMALLSGLGANAGAAGLVLVGVAVFTIAGFCAGVIILLATM